MSALPEWIADPALRQVWERIRLRFEKAGLVAHGNVQISTTTREERHAVGALLGRTITRGSTRIDLAVLDARLRERSGSGGLAVILAELFAVAPADRPAAKAEHEAARERPLVLAADLVREPWASDWIAGLRRTGLLTNRPDAERVVRQSATVLSPLTGASDAAHPQSQVELGARLLGDAHALDRDRLLHQVVMRGLAAAAGVALPDNAGDRERLWATYGVEPDLLSRTCLVWRLAVDGDTAPARRINEAGVAGDPIHLTEWDLRRIGGLSVGPDTRVLVCENPRVVEGMAEQGPEGWSAVCTAGEPNLVIGKVLSTLSSAGAHLHYHGDFDWPGIAIANRVLARYGASLWRMSADDYLHALRPDGLRLLGNPVEPSWDPELGATMRSHGRAVHEEADLAGLLESLGS